VKWNRDQNLAQENEEIHKGIQVKFNKIESTIGSVQKLRKTTVKVNGEWQNLTLS